jgi:hypothetical protein
VVERHRLGFDDQRVELGLTKEVPENAVDADAVRIDERCDSAGSEGQPESPVGKSGLRTIAKYLREQRLDGEDADHE